MSRYIDIEPIEKQIEFELTIGQCKTFSEREKGVLNIYDAIKNAPTADVEKVIRCKDCKYCDKENEHEYWCTGRGFPCQLTTPDDYCSKGRKKRDAEEVVRCFKCKYSHISTKDMLLKCRLNDDRCTDPYGYCYKGKEKEI